MFTIQLEIVQAASTTQAVYTALQRRRTGERVLLVTDRFDTVCDALDAEVVDCFHYKLGSAERLTVAERFLLTYEGMYAYLPHYLAPDYEVVILDFAIDSLYSDVREQLTDFMLPDKSDAPSV